MGRPLAPDEEFVFFFPSFHLGEYSFTPFFLRFDLDLPAECDDDYWQTGFVQPPHEPSVVSAFIMNIKLNRILASALVQLVGVFFGGGDDSVVNYVSSSFQCVVVQHQTIPYATACTY